MKDWNDILGKTIEQTGAEAIHLLEGAISEGCLSTMPLPQTRGKNIFGRTAYQQVGADLSFLAGLVATGLRGSAFLHGNELTANYNQLADLVRQHLGTVVHFVTHGAEEKGTAPFTGYSDLHAVAGTGCFQFVAANLQEAIDFTLIAHKVAERALIPGICAMDGRPTAYEVQRATVPPVEMLRQFLGEPDTHINPPSPAQEIIFGKERRRLPQWFSLDTPVMNGARKDPHALDLEGAARDRYFFRHLPAIIVAVMKEYAGLIGRAYASINGHRAERSDYLILTLGGAYEQVIPIVDHLRSQEKMKVGCLNISVLRPFPDEALAALLKGVKGLTVLEGFSGRESGEAPLFREVKAVVQTLGKRAPKMFSARYGSAFSPEALITAAKNMTKKNGQRERFYLDIDFTRFNSSLPQHEILLQSITRAYPDITTESIRGAYPARQGERNLSPSLPVAIRRYRDEGPPFTRLSRFYHHTACFYQRGVEVELVADPFQALPALPAATASFADVAGGRSSLPVFQPQNCTGCGACFTYCPHSAIPPIAIGPESLIRSAMDIAARQGNPVTGLTPMVRNLAKVAGQIIMERRTEITCVDDFLPEAFDRLAEQMKLSGERLEQARQEVGILRNYIGAFPVAVTETFFQDPGATAGELFSLAVDPHACTGCGLCAEICQEAALVMHPPEASMAQQLEKTLGLWEQLPDTPADTVRRLIHQESYDSFAATLLSRNFYLSTTGGSTSEAGAPAKTMMHLLTAVAESVVQPRLAQQITDIKKRIDDLASNIHSHLSNALPREDFHLALEELRESKLPLDAVIRHLRTEGQTKMVDAPALQRKVELLNDLKELHWALREGPTGSGRARYGLSLSASEATPWGDDYPFNVFTAPVIWHWDGAAPERLRGMVLGLRRHLIDNIRLLRRADLEIKDKYRPELHDREIGHLQWDHLEDHEKQLLAPLLLVGDHRLLSAAYSSGLLELLTLDLPVKVVILDNAAGTTRAALARSNTTLYAAMTLQHAQIMRGSLGAGQAMFDGLREGIFSPQPALFHLLTPDPRRHRDDGRRWPALFSLGLHSRAFPFLRYDPDLTSGYLASDISLGANPETDQTWVTKTLTYLEEGEEKEITYELTYADWLFTQKDWQAHFRPLQAGETPVPVAGYLYLSPNERTDKVPVVFTVDEERNLLQYVAMPGVIAATQDARRQWSHLREIAGTLTPFPEKLRKQVESELTEKYEQSMAGLRASFEEKLQLQERNMMEQVRRKLRDKLLALSKQGKRH